MGATTRSLMALPTLCQWPRKILDQMTETAPTFFIHGKNDGPNLAPAAFHSVYPVPGRVFRMPLQASKNATNPDYGRCRYLDASPKKVQ